MLPIFCFQNDLSWKFSFWVLEHVFTLPKKARKCVYLAKEKNVLNIPSYFWFLLQFWPTYCMTSKMLHETSKFKIRRMVQTWLSHKSNPNSHYANAVFKFMKIWAVKTRQNLAFFSADVKCKVSIGEPDCPIVLVTCGKRIIVGSNETFMIGDHHFIKLSLTPVAYLLHELPKLDDSEESPKVGEWYTGQVYYRLKSMVTEGFSGIHCAAEPSEVTTQQFEKHLAHLYPCTAGDLNINWIIYQVKNHTFHFFKTWLWWNCS